MWGTIGWIVAGLFVGFLGWSASINIFKLAAVSAIPWDSIRFTLPHTPPPAKGKPLDVRTLFMARRLPFAGAARRSSCLSSARL